MSAAEPQQRVRPWGRSIGVLMGCFATLIGVACNIDPFVVLQRAVLAGLVCGVVAAIIAAVAR